MSRKTQGIVLIVVGVVAVIVSLGADAIGLGAAPSIGWKQALGALVGVIIVAVGAWYWPGFPQSRMLGDARVHRGSVRASGARRKPRATKRSRKSAKRSRR
jgi:cytochrome c biogenesis protein CcdA